MNTENTTTQTPAATLAVREFETLRGPIDNRAKAFRKELEDLHLRVGEQVRNEIMRMSEDQSRLVKGLLKRCSGQMDNVSQQMMRDLRNVGVTYEADNEGRLNGVQLALPMGSSGSLMRDFLDRYCAEMIRPAAEAVRRDVEAV